MKDQNNNVNGHSFYDIHNSHAVCSFFDNIWFEFATRWI
jgi:hypothetical protein